MESIKKGGKVGHVYYIVMEACKGYNLKDILLKTGPF